MMNSEPLTLSKVLEVINRRKFVLLVPIALLSLASIILAKMLPSHYRSISTILIEERGVPDDYVQDSGSDYADQQIQLVKQKIKSSNKLADILENYNLFPELRKEQTIDQLVNKLRNGIRLELINSEVVNQRTGRLSEVTIAFTLSYEGTDNPETVQRVAEALTEYFLAENTLNREKRADERSKFFEAELTKAQNELDLVEADLSLYKRKHLNSLPDLLQTNVRNYESTERELLSLSDQLQNLRERESSIAVQLSAIPSNLESQNSETRLEELKMELIDLKTRFTDEYPDVQRIKDEIVNLEQDIGTSGKSSQTSGRQPDNPAYVSLAAQLSSIRVEIGSLKQRIGELSEKKTIYQQRIEETPIVEAEYNTLTSKRDTLLDQVNELMKNLMESKVVQGLEEGQKLRQLTLIEPASVPDYPFKPNRLAIVMLGIIFSIGLGIVATTVAEYNDDSVRDQERLAKETAFPVLATIPELK